MSKLIDTNVIRNTIATLKANPNVFTEELTKDLEEALRQAERANLETNYSKTIGSCIPTSLKDGRLHASGWDFIGNTLIEAFTWDDIDDVPGNLMVFDRLGRLLRHLGGSWRVYFSGTQFGHNISDMDLKSAAPYSLFYNPDQE